MKNDKTEFMGNGGDFYKTIAHAIEKEDYKEWFTNLLAKEYIAALPVMYRATKDANRRFALYLEAEKAAQIYAMLVYYIYPNRPKFRKEIGSNKELSENFAMVKDWMEENGGREYAEGTFGFPAGEAKPEGSS
ncbi:MAG: hypothetical protein WC263_01780 [Candidatus Micrarchaeia archaeon]|jgi:hypothetical protein